MRAVAAVLVLGCSSTAPRAPEPAPTNVAPAPSDAAPAPEPAPLRGAQLIADDSRLGSEVVVNIYEPLRNSNETSAAHPGQVAMSLPRGGQLNLVAARDDEDLAGGALETLPDPLRPPIRVRGVLVRDDEREQRSGRTWRLLVVREITELEYPTPVATSAAELVAEPERFHDRYVVVEGSWLAGFEASYLDKEVWIDFYPDAAVRCKPARLPEYKPVKVRATGYARTTGGGYGHLNMAKAELVATELVYLKPRAPGCEP